MADDDKQQKARKSAQIMDVAKPGKSMPSATSRPVIAGRRIMPRDSTIKDTQPDDSSAPNADEGEKVKVSRSAPKVIKPLSELDDEGNDKEAGTPGEAKTEDYISAISDDSTENDTDKPAGKPEAAAESPEAAILNPSDPEATDDKKLEDTENTGVTDEQPEDSADTNKNITQNEEAEPSGSEDSGAEPDEASEQTDEAATVGAVAEQAANKKSSPKQQSAEEQERQEKIAQLISEKKYFLPVRTPKRDRRAAWIVLALVLLLAAGIGAAYATGNLDLSGTGWFGSSDNGESSDAATETPAAGIEADSSIDTPSEPIVASSEDDERLTDISSIKRYVEAYYVTNSRYPTLKQINDSGFRAENFSGLDDEAYSDPAGDDAGMLATVSSKGVYGYAATPAGCDNDEIMCSGYKLTASLSDGTVHEAESSD